MQSPTTNHQPILRSFAYSIEFLAEQVADLKAAELVKQPAGILNHPAWTMGHLTCICQMLGGALGVLPWLPEGYADRYGAGSVPTSDVTRYETPETGMARLRDAQSRLTRAIEALDDSQLRAPFPDPAYQEIFPTLEDALTQVLVGHTSYHVGQLSAWRKAMRLGPMQRGFE